MDVLIQEAYSRSLDILRRCATPAGFRASGAEPGYPQIWARDSIITSLGAALTGETSSENAGAVDANLWYILGHYYHFLRTGDLAYLQANWPRIEATVI